MIKKVDLLICIRCCGANCIDFVIDTWQAAKYHTNPNTTEVVFAVDGGDPRFGKKMLSFFNKSIVYVSNTKWGWGAGLFSLLLESIKHYETIYNFNHFQTIDYDTLYINPGADKYILDAINSDEIGLLGCHIKNNAHWKEIFGREKVKFEKTFGVVPDSYVKGEGIQGGWMTMTRSLIDAMRGRGMLEPPYLLARNHTTIADDHLLPIFNRMCNLSIINCSSIGRCTWTAQNDPRGLEKKGIMVFHPTKLRPRNTNRSTEIEIRNYFRKIRSCQDMLK